jgi:hypothetical protein
MFISVTMVAMVTLATRVTLATMIALVTMVTDLTQADRETDGQTWSALYAFFSCASCKQRIIM